MDMSIREQPEPVGKPSRTILIADDDPESLADLTEVLRGWGYAVIPAGDGRAALDAARTKVDVVITDYRMPRMDGLEFIDALRRIDPKVPIILVTAHGGVETYLKAFSMGIFEYVNKPFNLKDIKRILRAALGAAGNAAVLMWQMQRPESPELHIRHAVKEQELNARKGCYE